jgi:hypothetical protein
MKPLAALALCLLLGSCSRSEPTPAAGSSAAPPASIPAPAVPAVPAAPPAPPPPATPVVALDGEGLRLVDPGSGSTRLLAFGTDVDTVLRALGSAMVPPGQRVEEECGGTVLGFGTLQLHTRDGRFLGWGLPEGSPLTTMSGVGLGTPRDEVAKSNTIDLLEDSTLGAEFSIGAIAGVFESGASDAPVAHLWAGETCIAR